MKFIISLLLLVAVCNAAPQQPQSQAQFNYQNYLNSQTTTTPAPIHPPASIHYVNIGQDLNGDYKFGYDTGKGPSGQSFREETRLPDGSVKGQYGYLDAANKMRIVKYTAGLNGFSIDSDTALNEQQIAASRPVAPNPQYNPAPEQPRQSLYNARQSFQGLAQAAQSSQPQYLPAPNQLAQQQPYSGYQAPQPTAQPSLAQYNPNAYGGQTLTREQAQQQALAAARARQAALARQQQQEAIIRQQQQAATEQILAQQRAALEAQQAAQQAAANSKQDSYQNLASQYAAAQPQYQAPQEQYQAPQPAPAPAPQPQPQYQPPSYSSSQYQPANRATELKPDVLSQFIQLPGTRLIQIDKPRPAKSSSLSSNLLSNSGSKLPEEEENYGPVVINAALLNYDIGSTRLPNGQPNNKA